MRRTGETLVEKIGRVDGLAIFPNVGRLLGSIEGPLEFHGHGDLTHAQFT